MWTSVLSSPVRTVGSVSSVQIRLTGSWSGSSVLQTPLDISASVSRGLQVSNTEETNQQKSHNFVNLLTISKFMSRYRRELLLQHR